MKYKLYQTKDELTRELGFLNLEDLQNMELSVSLDNYNQVYEGEIDSNSLEDIYTKFNMHHPQDFNGRSMSISDIVENCDTKEFYYCDSFGFKKIDLEHEQNKALDASVTKENMIEVLMIETAKEPSVRQIENTLKAMQKIVGGLIEIIEIENGINIVLNDKGKIDELPGNRRFGNDIIAGTFFVCGSNHQGDLMSLNQEQISKYTEMFRYPEIITPQQVQDSIYMEFVPYEDLKDNTSKFLFRAIEISTPIKDYLSVQPLGISPREALAYAVDEIMPQMKEYIKENAPLILTANSKECTYIGEFDKFDKSIMEGLCENYYRFKESGLIKESDFSYLYDLQFDKPLEKSNQEENQQEPENEDDYEIGD